MARPSIVCRQYELCLFVLIRHLAEQFLKLGDVFHASLDAFFGVLLLPLGIPMA
mgnify:CR=1 FL=1